VEWGTAPGGLPLAARPGPAQIRDALAARSIIAAAMLMIGYLAGSACATRLRDCGATTAATTNLQAQRTMREGDGLEVEVEVESWRVHGYTVVITYENVLK
jgi:hypothetical protein